MTAPVLVAVREAVAGDAVGLGVLCLEALRDTLSAEIEAAELPQDALAVGTQMLVQTVERGGGVWVAEISGRLAGAAQTHAREFARARHVHDVALLVHPAARRQRVGTALLAAVTEAARRGPLAVKLAGRVAEDDEGARRLLARAGWIVERVERGALRRDDQLRDVWVHGLVLHEHPVATKP